MNEPTNRTLLVTMLVLGGIIILILLVPRSQLAGTYAYNSNGLLSASVTPINDNTNYTYYPQQRNLDFGGYTPYTQSNTTYTSYSNTTTPKTTKTYTYSYPTTTTYDQYQDYNNYNYGNDYLYPNNYNQYQSPTTSPNYNSNYPGGCNPGYRYSVVTGQYCNSVY